MKDILAAVVMICVSLTFFGGFLGFFAFLRYLRHKETMALAEKGLLRAERITQPTGENKNVLRWAVMLIAVGCALCIGLYPIGFVAMPGEFPLNFGPWMIAGLLPLFFGFGLLIIYLIPTLQILVQRGLPNQPHLSAPATSPELTTQQTDERVQIPQPETSQKDSV
ncbi:MAG: DUF6249 domain-containing protein [Caldilineaceae bacterium]